MKETIKKNVFKTFDRERNEYLSTLLESFIFKYSEDSLKNLKDRQKVYLDLMRKTIEIVSSYYEEKIDDALKEWEYDPRDGFFTSKKTTVYKIDPKDEEEFLKKFEMDSI